MYAPVAGVHMQAGWLIGAALQPLGMRGRTRRSQSEICLKFSPVAHQRPVITYVL